MIPSPPRNPLSMKRQPEYIEVEWTADQVDFTLRTVIDRILIDSTAYEISKDKQMGNPISIKSPNVFIGLEKDSYRVFMILDNKAAGTFYPRFWFWKDRKVKKTIAGLRDSIVNAEAIALKKQQLEEQRYKNEVAKEALFNTFPEAITQEFEKHVLTSNVESKDGEEETAPAGSDSTGS